MAFSLDYPGVGPEHSFLKDAGRAEYYSVTDEEALDGIDAISLFQMFDGCLNTPGLLSYYLISVRESGTLKL